jgi:hypothetical protein
MAHNWEMVAKQGKFIEDPPHFFTVSLTVTNFGTVTGQGNFRFIEDDAI